MHPGKDRFISFFQQIFVVATVAAVLLPAASIIKVDVVPGDAPAAASSGAAVGDFGPVAAHGSGQSSRVEAAAVAPDVREIALNPAGPGAGATLGRTAPGQTGPAAAGGAVHRVLSAPQPIEGYGTIGVTWSNQIRLRDGAISVQARTRTGGRWSGWTTLAYHDDHGPDPDSAEGATGTAGNRPAAGRRCR